MHQLVQQGSRFIIATHAPILMAYRDAWIYWIDEFGIERKKYKETQHYQIMRDFVNQPERMLSVLLGE
ncbi:MAG: hypothetical protein JEZ00_21170 [Anaerolineaceae bacterium]|nr:hypothetical protein [Anaerolineaceae bacterium]